MQNPFYMDNVVATASQSEPENELVSISGHLPSELAAQVPSVVEDSADVHVGPHLQNHGPVTVKQYTVLKGKDGIRSLAENSSKNTDITTLQPPEDANTDDAALKQPSKDELTFQKHAWLRNRYVWSSLVIVLVVAIIAATVAALSEAEPKNIPPNTVPVTDKVYFQYENEEVDVFEGHRSVEWVVEVTASSQPTLVWYGPKCIMLEESDGPARHQVYTSPTGTVTKLKLYNISLADRGLYRLQAHNKEGEEWAYFTLNVKGKNSVDRQHVVVCYVAGWARWRQGLGSFTVDNIDPTLCTHLVYAFANLNMSRNAIESSSPDYDLGENNGTGAYRKMTSLKEHYPHLKVLIAMGGWAERINKNYSAVAESPSRRKAFVSSVSEFLRKYNFDGLDLHWQYPADGGANGVPTDKENFVLLLKDLREEFDKYGWLLTAPLGVMPDTMERSYDVPAVSQYLHYMFALCYAYHGHWNSQTGPNAPLYPSYDDDNLNVESSIRTLLFKGAARNKLVLGIPLYGRIFRLKNTEGNVGFQKDSAGAGMLGPYVQEPGFWGYNEICLEVDNPIYNWKKYWDYVTHTPYAYKGNQVIAYDDARSLTDKVELAVRKKLAGVVVWSLDTDDFRGDCTFGRSGSTGYPLMQAINNALDNSRSWKKVSCPTRSSARGPVY